MKTMVMYSAQLDVFRQMPAETEWLEFKEAKTQFDNDELGRYVTALSNEANLCGQEAAWLIFGVKDKINPATQTRPVVGSSYATSAAALNELKRQIFSFTSPALGLSDPIELAHAEELADSVALARTRRCFHRGGANWPQPGAQRGVAHQALRIV